MRLRERHRARLTNVATLAEQPLRCFGVLLYVKPEHCCTARAIIGQQWREFAANAMTTTTMISVACALGLCVCVCDAPQCTRLNSDQTTENVQKAAAVSLSRVRPVSPSMSPTREGNVVDNLRTFASQFPDSVAQQE